MISKVFSKRARRFAASGLLPWIPDKMSAALALKSNCAANALGSPEAAAFSTAAANDSASTLVTGEALRDGKLLLVDALAAGDSVWWTDDPWGEAPFTALLFATAGAAILRCSHR